MFNVIRKLRQPQFLEQEFPWETYGLNRQIGDSPLLSVILPVYNHSHYIIRAVESILSQKGVRLEIVLVDDGSTDDLREKLAALKRLPQLKVIHKPDNEGLAEALNTGFDNCRGAFVTWTSADNIYLPGALARMQSYLFANPAVGMVYANMELIDDDDQLVPAKNFRPAEAIADSPAVDLPRNTDSLIEYPDNFIGACFLLRHAAWQSAGRHRDCFRGAEDYDFWLAVKRQWRILRLPEKKPYYRYRLHSNSLTTNLGASFIVKNTENALREFHELGAATPQLPISVSQETSLHSAVSSDSIATQAFDPLQLFDTEKSFKTLPGFLSKQEPAFSEIRFSSFLRRSYCSDFQSVTNQENGFKLFFIPLIQDDLREALPSIECRQADLRSGPATIFVASVTCGAKCQPPCLNPCLPADNLVNPISDISVCFVELSNEYRDEEQKLRNTIDDKNTAVVGAYQRALTFLISGVNSLFFTVSERVLEDNPQLVLAAIYRRLVLGAISRRPLILTQELFQHLLNWAEAETDNQLSSLAGKILLFPHILSVSQASKLSGGDLVKFVTIGSYEQVLMQNGRQTTCF